MLNWSAKRFQKLKYLSRGTQRPNVSKYVRSVSNVFFFPNALEACLVNLELPCKLFICSDVVWEL